MGRNGKNVTKPKKSKKGKKCNKTDTNDKYTSAGHCEGGVEPSSGDGNEDDGMVYVFCLVNFRSVRGLIRAVALGIRECESVCCVELENSSLCVSTVFVELLAIFETSCIFFGFLIIVRCLISIFVIQLWHLSMSVSSAFVKTSCKSVFVAELLVIFFSTVVFVDFS